MAEAETGQEETEKERLDRNLSQLLEELRVAIPGVQVLFAFLLTVPFTQRFERLTSFEETVYFVTTLCAAGATVLLISPSAHHRIEFRQGHKLDIVMLANVLAIAGLGLLALAVTGAVLLVTHLLYGTATAAAVSGALGGLFLTLWYVVPVVRRLRDSRRTTGAGADPAA
ncbi:MAG TPA: DUF6328 family protein [Thermoleophilaceae bacterium]|nr:DUF6328 family protein [Thermoleophilaceae bacterium]